VQYALIALNRQRWITLSFLLGAGFNLAANLALIPIYGYVGASVVTVVSELVLLAPFWFVLRKELPPIGLPALLWRPAIAAAIMGGAVWAVAEWSPLIAVAVGGLVYLAAALALGAVSREDREALRRALSRRTVEAT
jgi:O-antigen/teichoic acid export membrane protein